MKEDCNEMCLEEVVTCKSKSEARERGGSSSKALLAYWRHLDQQTGKMDCYDSFLIDSPVAFKVGNENLARDCQKTFLYRGHTAEVFWFSRSGSAIKLSIISSNHSVYPVQYEVSPESQLFKFVEQGSSFFGIQPVPTLIRDCNDRHICIFTHHSIGPVGTHGVEGLHATVYFYDVQEKREIAKATGATLFLNQRAAANASNSHESVLSFFCDMHLASPGCPPPGDESDLTSSILTFLEDTPVTSRA